MTLGQNSVKPGRFPLRQKKLSALLLAFFCGLIPNLAQAESELGESDSPIQKLDDINNDHRLSPAVKEKFSKKCVEDYTKIFRSFKAADIHLAALEQRDKIENSYCKKNHNQGALAGHNKIQNRSLIPKLRSRELRKNQNIPHTYGRCEATLTAVNTSFRALTTARENSCDETAERLTQFERCLATDSIDPSCETAYKNIVAALGRSHNSIKTASEEVLQYIKKFPDLNKAAKDNYKKDKDQLEIYNTKHAADPVAARANTTNLPNPENGAAATVEDYMDRLGIARHNSVNRINSVAAAGSLINEQNNAEIFAREFTKAILAFKAKEVAASSELTREFQRRIKHLANKKTGERSVIDQLAPVAGPAVGAVTPFLGGAATAPAAAAAVSGSAASALPALGAVALAGAAVGSSAASRQSFDAGGIPSPQAPAAALPTSNLLGDAAATATKAALPGSSPLKQVDVEKATNEGGAPPPNLFLAGASSQNGGKLRPTKKASPTTVEATTPDEVPASFGGELKPGPRPKKDDGMGEVSSLLGQMKNLFNFDEGLGMDPMAGGMPLDPNAAFRDPATSSGGGSTGGEEYYGDSSEPSEESVGEEGEIEQASGAIGGVTISLFSRVHNRHRICMEKGLVLNGIGGIPE